MALGLVDQFLQFMRKWLSDNGPDYVFKSLVFLMIVGLFKVLSSITRRITRRVLASRRFQASQLLRDMMTTIVSNVVLVLGVLVGIAGFIVGFALQDSLGNFAAGVMILSVRPYDIDDMVDVAGIYGRVSRMSRISTTILTIDNQTLVIPNGKIWGGVIKNVTDQELAAWT